MKNVFKSLILFTVIITFAACSKTTTYTKTLDNQTDETITLDFTINGNEIELSVPPNSIGSTITNEQDGDDIDPEYNCTNEFETIEATVSDNKILTLNLLDDNNWSLQTGDDVNCTIVVTQADIQ